jgi:hypothetical protein
MSRPRETIITAQGVSGTLKKALLAGCSKTARYKATEIPRNETYSPVRRRVMRDEGNAADGRFSATCWGLEEGKTCISGFTVT